MWYESLRISLLPKSISSEATFRTRPSKSSSKMSPTRHFWSSSQPVIVASNQVKQNLFHKQYKEDIAQEKKFIDFLKQ